MADANFNTDAVLEALREKAKTPNKKSNGMKDILATESFQAVIKELKAARYSIPDIAEFISQQEGITQSKSTIAIYLREIENANRGEADAKAPRKPKASKPRVEEKAETKSVEKPAAKPADKPTASEGKTLTAKPAMGGAFSDEL